MLIIYYYETNGHESRKDCKKKKPASISVCRSKYRIIVFPALKTRCEEARLTRLREQGQWFHGWHWKTLKTWRRRVGHSKISNSKSDFRSNGHKWPEDYAGLNRIWKFVFFLGCTIGNTTNNNCLSLFMILLFYNMMRTNVLKRLKKIAVLQFLVDKPLSEINCRYLYNI